jgi:hypothetical protein
LVGKDLAEAETNADKAAVAMQVGGAIKHINKSLLEKLKNDKRCQI